MMIDEWSVDRYIQVQVYMLLTTEKTSTRCQISNVSTIYTFENNWSEAEQIISIVKAVWITSVLHTNHQPPGWIILFIFD